MELWVSARKCATGCACACRSPIIQISTLKNAGPIHSTFPALGYFETALLGYMNDQTNVVILTSGGQCSLKWSTTIFNFLWAWPYFYYSMLDDSHSYSMYPVQCNSNRFRLLHDTQMFPSPIMRLLLPSLRMKVYNLGAQVKIHFSNEGNRLTHSIPPCTLLPASSWSRV